MIVESQKRGREGRIVAVLHALLAILILGHLAWAPDAGAQTSPGVPAATFRIGDAVRVDVWNNTTFSGQFDIADDGTVIHPIYRSIRIAGLTVPQAEEEFRRVLRRYQSDPELIIEPLFRVTISGAVNAPNILSLPPHATLAQALHQAGGPAANADLSRVRLLREGRETPLDLRHPDNEFANMRVRSGDHIIVDPRRSIWRDTLEPGIRTAGSLASIAYLIIRLTTNVR